MKRKLIKLIILSTTLLASGGYDSGKSAGKGNWDISLTWNPFNFFEQGQSYAILGYGLTEKTDLHAYYSSSDKSNNNYYAGVFYQFINSKTFDIATAIGIRGYSESSKVHLFFPQILYSINLINSISLGGSFVTIQETSNKLLLKGIATDIFISKKIYTSDKIEVDFSLGAFSPALWEPNTGNWHATYSFDIKIVNIK